MIKQSLSRLLRRARLTVEYRLVARSGMFDGDWYRLAYPDVARSQANPIVHYLTRGADLGYAPSRRFDTRQYVIDYPDAAASPRNPLIHFLAVGKRRGDIPAPAPPSAADRIRASGLFDADWYLAKYPDVSSARYPPLLHYMVYGAVEGRSTGPGFDAEWYLGRYPDIVGANPLLHYVDHGVQEGRKPCPPGRILDLARSVVATVEDLDPALSAFDYFADSASLDVVDGSANNRLERAFAEIVRTIVDAPSRIVFMPWLTHGGADLVACHAAGAMADADGAASILVVLTDHDRAEAREFLPDGVVLTSLSRIDPDLTATERAELVELIVRALRPESVLNVNSRACWDMYRARARVVRHFSRLFAMLFCPDYSADGRACGYGDTHLRDSMPFLEGIYFDNATYIAQVAEKFGFPPHLRSRLVPLYQPAPSIAPVRRADRTTRPFRVLWAGRLSRQKNIDVLVSIVESAPSFEIHVWGRGDKDAEDALSELAARRPGLKFRGPFERFEKLPLGDYDAFLYTSLWDGIPNVLLESGAAGLPIVASAVGGVGELVDEETGWLIDDIDDAWAYVQALDEIRAHPDQADQRAKAMLVRLGRRHNWETYRETLAREPQEAGGLIHAANRNHGGAQRPSRRVDGKTIPRKPAARRDDGRARRSRR